MSKPSPPIWDGTYQPTQAELEESVQLEGAHDHDIDEALERILSFRPPPNATWPADR